MASNQATASLNDAGGVSGTDAVEIDRGGLPFKTTVDDIAAGVADSIDAAVLDAPQTFTAEQEFVGVTLKRGANGRVGTFVANGVTPVVVANTSIAATDAVIISLGVVGGTVGALPTIKTLTPGVGFTVAATAADTSTYNYAIIKNAA